MAQPLSYDPTLRLYVWRGAFEQRDIPKAAGFQWNPNMRAWTTGSPGRASDLIEYADIPTAKRLHAVQVARADALALSHALDADINIPAPDGCEYRGYQKGGVAFAVKNHNVLIGDEMGLGKTIQALGVINHTNAYPALVIAPNVVKLNWAREALKWLVRPGVTVGVVQGGKDTAANRAAFAADVVVVNYDVLKPHRTPLRSREWEIVVLDESHYIKNYGAARTREIVGHWDADAGAYSVPPIPAKQKIAMTGTAILNRPPELYSTLNWLMPGKWGTFIGFCTRYTDRYNNGYGWVNEGIRNAEELQERLRTTCMVRRLKADVEKELPPKRWQVVEITPGTAAKRMLRQEAEFTTGLRESAHSRCPVPFTEMARIRSEMAAAKLADAPEFLLNAAEQSGRLVVFMHHVERLMRPLAAVLEKAGKRVAMLHGGVSVASRQRIVDQFQAGEIDILLGQIKAAGVGITLTRADHVVFVEQDWTPGWMQQAEDRLHRIGQTADRVLIQYLVYPESLDAYMAHLLVEKSEVVAAALDGFRGVEVSDLAAVEARILALEAEKGPRKLPSCPAELRDLAHRAVRELAYVCDGARARDGAGFNGMDAAFGRKMAALPALSDGQAWACLRMLAKYRRQLTEYMGGETVAALGI